MTLPHQLRDCWEFSVRGVEANKFTIFNVLVMKSIFFGTTPLAQHVLPALHKAGLTPSLIVAGADIPVRKTNELVAPYEKSWALEHGVPYVQPTTLDEAFLDTLRAQQAECFVVASYGRILPQTLLSMPPKGVVNLHPSLLPRLRGPSPMRSAILHNESTVGVSIMVLDEEMDHGPLLAQQVVPVQPWPLPGRQLDDILGAAGAQLLADTLPQWIAGTLQPTEQDHTQATYCSMFTKQDGEIDIVHGDPRQNFAKICAFDGWPGTFFFVQRNGKTIRVVIAAAHMHGDQLVIDRVVPEGKKEMAYTDFLRG